MQSEAVEKCVQSAVLSVIAEHPMGHWRDDQVKEVARRAIAEAALSTDAEPVAIYKGNGLVDCGESGHHNIELLKLIPGNTLLYADPVKTAPAVAVKATPEALEQFTAYFVKNYPGPDTIIFDPKWHAPKIFRAAISALSAQVQDVVIPEGWQLVPIKPTKGMAYAAACAHYGKKRVDQTGIEGISMTVNNIDYNFATAFRRFWKGALAASPASKHGDAE